MQSCTHPTFFTPLWFLEGEKDKGGEQCGVSRVCPLLPSCPHLTEGGPGH